MNTEKLFYNDVYLKESTATIVSCEEAKNTSVSSASADGISKTEIIVVLDKTIFFPTGGGQSCDLGTINDFEVIDVSEDENYIYHTILTPRPLSEIPELKAGSTVSLKIDWDRRFDNMQRHCGEHILSGIFFREYGGINRGFHMGQDYMTLDISLEEKPEFTKITWDMAKHVELCANQVIWSNAPVSRKVYNSREETIGLPLRKALAIDSDISIVCVGSEENAADCVACCGTHPSTAGQVGLIKIFKIEPNKGMFRIYCEAGKRALEDYDHKHDIITTLGNKYSATADTLLEQMARDEEKIKAVRNELYILKNSVIKERAAFIEEEIKSGAEAHQNNGIFVYEYSDLKTDDVMAIGRAVTAKAPKLLLLISSTDNVLLLFSDGKTCDCGKIVKDNAGIYNGKGGGRSDNARAMFPNREYLYTFIDLVEKHLR